MKHASIAATMTPEEAISHYGSQAAVARACDVTDSAVYLWVKQGFIPYDKQCQIQVDSSGGLIASKGHAKPSDRKEGAAAA